MSTQMLALILVFVFAVLALLGLGARSFIQLVELILSNGSKVEALAQELQRALTALSKGQEPDITLPLPDVTPTTPDNPTLPLTPNTTETK